MWPSIWSVLENGPRALGKNMYSTIVRWSDCIWRQDKNNLSLTLIRKQYQKETYIENVYSTDLSCLLKSQETFLPEGP